MMTEDDYIKRLKILTLEQLTEAKSIANKFLKSKRSDEDVDNMIAELVGIGLDGEIIEALLLL